MTKTERNQAIDDYVNHRIKFSELKTVLDEWNQQVNICYKCQSFPAEIGGVCQPCRDYEEHCYIY